MVLMAAILVGVVIIQLIVYLEGSLQVDWMVFAHATPQMAILALNMYVITLEDHHEYYFFKKGIGLTFINISFFYSILSFAVILYTVYLRYQDGDSPSEYESDDPYYVDESNLRLSVEYSIIYAIAFIQSLSL
eukprot:CAMPEP_0170557612 /NCGR_PEP_ID=MMETSP0211-20121228/28389_1 /TAXON_ID=311385 /ORGANISM="Pseudokeronopsis sp., Strain OXSARD2" /LENGTH=132 /DNA_ID=CAMNT_0010868799 /DNA_START=174 /DNA_END=568 /DNA_ORIENTATION=+